MAVASCEWLLETQMETPTERIKTEKGLRDTAQW